MPTSNLAAGLGLRNLSFDGTAAGAPATGAGVVGGGSSGSAEGFPAVLADQIVSVRNASQDTDKKDNDGVDIATLMVAIETAVVSPVTPAVQPFVPPETASESGGPDTAPAPVAVGSPEVAVESAGSALPGGRQVRAAGLPVADRDWLGSQLEALGRERLADPVVMPPGAAATASGLALRGAQFQADGAAGTEPRVASPLIPPAAGPTVADTPSPVAAVTEGAASQVPPVAGRFFAPASAAAVTTRELPALPEQAARTLPAAAYHRADQPMPPPDPRAGVVTPGTGIATEPSPVSRGPAVMARGVAPTSSAAVASRTQPGERMAEPPAVISTPPSTAVTAATGPGHAGDREVPGSGMRAADPTPNAPARGASAVAVSTGEPAASSSVPAREVAPAASWLAAQMAMLPGSATPSPRGALPLRGASPQGAVPDAAQLPPGVAGAASPWAVAGDARATAGTSLAPVDAGLDSKSASGADVLDSASRGPGLPAAGSAVAAAQHTRADTAVAPVLSPPLQLASAGFGEDLGQRILWLSGNNLKSADIQLDPPELGPLQITVQAHRDGTTVHFTTHSAQAREAVEATLPRLRELLEGSGAGTVDVNLAHQQQPDQRAGRHEGVGLATGTARAARTEPAAMAVASRVRQGLIDDYA